MQVSIFGACPQWQGCGWKGIWRKNGRRGMTEMAAELVGWLEFNVPFQHKYGYIRDEWHPAGWSVCLPLLSSLAPQKSRRFLLALAHTGSPGIRAIKRLCVSVCTQVKK